MLLWEVLTLFGVTWLKWDNLNMGIFKQDAQGLRLAHLSDIATADMQMLCNIFPILSLQLMKGPSFKQLLILNKNMWAWQSVEHDHLNKLSISFQQMVQCEIWWKFLGWVVSKELFNNIMILYNVNSTGQGNIINVKKMAFGNKELTTDKKWESRFYWLLISSNEVFNTAYCSFGGVVI